MTLSPNKKTSTNFNKIKKEVMTEVDIEFIMNELKTVCTIKKHVVKTTNIQEARLSGDSKDSKSKFKKWQPQEVGRLVFCLWEIHQRRGDNSPVQFRASRRLR